LSSRAHGCLALACASQRVCSGLGTWLRAWLEKKKQKILLSKKKKKKTDAHMHQGERLTPADF